MSIRQTSPVIRFIHRLTPARGAGALPDRVLLEHFLKRRDGCAFAALVERHGPLVLGVCRRVLQHAQDAEDAFQATFLVLARKAASIVRRESVGSWLYGVASRIALKARARSARARRREAPLQELPGPEAAGRWDDNDFRAVLDEELNRLPDKYRIAVVLCYLEGKTTAEAAQAIGCARGTLLSRLARARERLRPRLARRGLALPAAVTVLGLAQTARAAVPLALARSTVDAVRAQFAGTSAGASISAHAAILARGALRAMFFSKLRALALALLAAGALAMGATLLAERAGAARSGDAPIPERVSGNPDAVRLPGPAAAKLGVRTGEVKPRVAPRVRLLKLAGTLTLDPMRLESVRCRVRGEIVEVAKIKTGDTVSKGDLLAVVASKELAEEKSKLVDALEQLRLDKEILAGAEKAAGTVPEIFLLNARKNVMAGSNAARRAERVLRALGATEAEIKGLKDYAASLAARKGKRDADKEKAWPLLKLRAPRNGVVVETNIAFGEFIAAPTMKLFQIADLSRLLVIANAPENELPALTALKREERVWTVRASGSPEVKGSIEEIGQLIDPNKHTAVVKGFIDNAGGHLRAGQFITATVVLPTLVEELVVPTSALVDDGRKFIVFVQPDPTNPVYVQRRVTVVRRGQDKAHVRFPLKTGERVVTAGAVDLKAALDDLKTERK
jgi:cobalt-zinc-cadmium efflux system membrane fusion protein